MKFLFILEQVLYVVAIFGLMSAFVDLMMIRERTPENVLPSFEAITSDLLGILAGFVELFLIIWGVTLPRKRREACMTSAVVV